jgi:lysozyme
MNISGNGVDFIKKEESCVLHAYQDSAGIWTIGYGSIDFMNGDPVRKGDAINQNLAEKMLQFEINKKVSGINDLLKGVELNQNQYDAICSFTFNCGIFALEISSLLKTIKNNPNDSTSLPINAVSDISVNNWMKKNNLSSIYKIEMDFLEWNKITVNGKHIFDEGLFERRKREWLLYHS